MGYGQAVAGSGDADIEQPPLFINGSLALGAFVGEEPVLGSDEPDLGILESLRGVQGDQGDAVTFLGFFLLALLLQDESVQKSAWPLLGMPLAVTGECIEQLADILHTVICLLVGLAPLLEILEVSALLEDRTQNRRGVGSRRLELDAIGPPILHETLDGSPCSGRADGEMLRVIEDGKKALAVFRPGLGGQLQSGRADAAGRIGQHTEKGIVVLGVEQGAEVGNDILHLAPVEKALPPHHAVGDAALAQRLLELTRLGVHSVEDGKIGPWTGLPTLGAGGLDLVDDELRLGLVIGGGEDADRIPLLAVAPEILSTAARVVFDEPVGHREDDIGAPVVLLELDDLRVGEVPLELQKIRRFRAAPSVDALVVVPHDADVRTSVTGKQADQLQLELVGVLKLVDEDVLVACAPRIPGLGVITQEFARLQQQVVEVHGIERAELVLVFGEKTPHGRAGLIGFADAEVLRLADDIAGQVRVERVFLVVNAGGELLHEPHLVRLVEDAEVFLVAEQRGVLPEDPNAECMERGEGDLLCLLGVHHPTDTLAHLLGGLVGEGDGKDR